MTDDNVSNGIAGIDPVRAWLESRSDEYLILCAEGEGGRARLCMEGYGNPNTAYYFAREAARYARVLLVRKQLAPAEEI